MCVSPVTVSAVVDCLTMRIRLHAVPEAAMIHPSYVRSTKWYQVADLVGRVFGSAWLPQGHRTRRLSPCHARQHSSSLSFALSLSSAAQATWRCIEHSGQRRQTTKQCQERCSPRWPLRPSTLSGTLLEGPRVARRGMCCALPMSACQNTGKTTQRTSVPLQDNGPSSRSFRFYIATCTASPLAFHFVQHAGLARSRNKE